MIIATIKPKKGILKIITTILESRISSFRINFSRGSFNDNFELIDECKFLFSKYSVDGNIFVDLPGNKFRLGKFKNGYSILKRKQLIRVSFGNTILCGNNQLYVNNDKLFSCSYIGNHLKLCDGTIILKIINKQNNNLSCEVIKGGRIYNRCSIVNSELYIENIELSNDDIRILNHIKDKVEYICPSFVDTNKIILQIKTIKEVKPKKGIIAKIESPIGLRNVTSIIKECDGLMLCRGDLKNFYSMYYINNNIANKLKQLCQLNDKKIIFATNYFKSMVDGSNINKHETSTLKKVQLMNPDYLIINETSHSEYWHKIIKVASNILNLDFNKSF